MCTHTNSSSILSYVFLLIVHPYQKSSGFVPVSISRSIRRFRRNICSHRCRHHHYRAADLGKETILRVGISKGVEKWWPKLKAFSILVHITRDSELTKDGWRGCVSKEDSIYRKRCWRGALKRNKSGKERLLNSKCCRSLLVYRLMLVKG